MPQLRKKTSPLLCQKRLPTGWKLWPTTDIEQPWYNLFITYDLNIFASRNTRTVCVAWRVDPRGPWFGGSCHVSAGVRKLSWIPYLLTRIEVSTPLKYDVLFAVNDLCYVVEAASFLTSVIKSRPPLYQFQQAAKGNYAQCRICLCWHLMTLVWQIFSHHWWLVSYDHVHRWRNCHPEIHCTNRNTFEGTWRNW